MDLRENERAKAKLLQYKLKPITQAQGLKVATKIGAHAYVECSALTQEGLQDVFKEAIIIALNPAENNSLATASNNNKNSAKEKSGTIPKRLPGVSVNGS